MLGTYLKEYSDAEVFTSKDIIGWQKHIWVYLFVLCTATDRYAYLCIFWFRVFFSVKRDHRVTKISMGFNLFFLYLLGFYNSRLSFLIFRIALYFSLKIGFIYLVFCVSDNILICFTGITFYRITVCRQLCMMRLWGLICMYEVSCDLRILASKSDIKVIWVV